ncbi:MAG: hypothetical protein K0V04_11785 [Deltaproteobacteria bacterium]|nr:hypothetical protein [Deltaproteobacteria bacterium]
MATTGATRSWGDASLRLVVLASLSVLPGCRQVNPEFGLGLGSSGSEATTGLAQTSDTGDTGQGPCDPPLAACGGECVDTQINVVHCGACNQACTSSQVCFEGECVFDCPVGQLACGPRCVDPSSDPSHCGRCDFPCDAFCVEGQCADTCPSNAPTECGGTCVDLATDSNHCGECDEPCDEFRACVDSECVLECPEELEQCDGQCVETSTDEDHCGRCGDPCDAGEHCQDGTCTLECGGNNLVCGGECINPNSNEMHCGDCDQPCGAAQNCGGGECKCPGSQQECGITCIPSGETCER